MSKAILVIDMPEWCVDCPCSFYKKDLTLVCNIVRKDTNNMGKPDWCPLKSVPEKLSEEYENKVKTINGDWITVDSRTDSVAVGYNKCIDEILGD